MLKLETILRKSQPELKRALTSELAWLGYKVHSERGFLYAKGRLPVLLVAHLDTVHVDRVKTICTSPDGRILMSPEGIGGDDRAGVYMVMELMKRHKCHVLFCEDEEDGGVGARYFTRNRFKPAVNYIIELDRRGADDAVFYDCENPSFTEFVCSFGFQENMGSFSDISVLAPYLGIAAVNLSSGYHNEHTRHEYIDLGEVQRNIDRVRAMLKTPTEQFEYIAAISTWDAPIFACRLAPLSTGDYLMGPGGEMIEPTSSICMDMNGTAYELWEEGYMAEELYGFRVLNAQNMPARFREDLATCVGVLPSDNY